MLAPNFGRTGSSQTVRRYFLSLVADALGIFHSRPLGMESGGPGRAPSRPEWSSGTLSTTREGPGPGFWQERLSGPEVQPVPRSQGSEVGLPHRPSFPMARPTDGDAEARPGPGAAQPAECGQQQTQHKPRLQVCTPGSLPGPGGPSPGTIRPILQMGVYLAAGLSRLWLRTPSKLLGLVVVPLPHVSAHVSSHDVTPLHTPAACWAPSFQGAALVHLHGCLSSPPSVSFYGHLLCTRPWSYRDKLPVG